MSFDNGRVDWPLQFPDELTDGTVSVRAYRRGDADELFSALADERAWEHIPRTIPLDGAALDVMIAVAAADGARVTFLVCVGSQIVGMTSVLFDPNDPQGVEVGGTQLSPAVWGTGVNRASKRLLFSVIFAQGAQWIQLRTDERNERSAAAIAKLGAQDLGVHPDTRVRRDGTQRRSRLFRVPRPC